jgi:serine/threonine protein kinase
MRVLLLTDGEFEMVGVRYPLSSALSRSLILSAANDPPDACGKVFCSTDVDLGHGLHFFFLQLTSLYLHGILAQWMDKEPTTRMISAYGLRAPEVILEADFDTKADIWSLGCMVSLIILLLPT